MKRLLLSLLAAALLVCVLVSCKQEEAATGTEQSKTTDGQPEPTNSTGRMVTCAIDFPTLLEDGSIQYGASMEPYDAATLEDVLKGGINGRTEVELDAIGNIAGIGGLKAENGYYFLISSSASIRKTYYDCPTYEIALKDGYTYSIEYTNEPRPITEEETE